MSTKKKKYRTFDFVIPEEVYQKLREISLKTSDAGGRSKMMGSIVRKALIHYFNCPYAEELPKPQPETQQNTRIEVEVAGKKLILTPINQPTTSSSHT